jgi:hypothetical protein
VRDHNSSPAALSALHNRPVIYFGIQPFAMTTEAPNNALTNANIRPAYALRTERPALSWASFTTPGQG